MRLKHKLPGILRRTEKGESVKRRRKGRIWLSRMSFDVFLTSDDLGLPARARICERTKNLCNSREKSSVEIDHAKESL